jgi:hypothetical protein
MSLINDALKQARETQQAAAPAPGSNLQLRPIEPNQEQRSHRGLAIPAVLAVAALAVLYFAWQSTQRQHAAAPLQVRGNNAGLVQRAPAPQPMAVQPSPAAVESAPAAAPAVAGSTPALEPMASPAVAVSAPGAEAGASTPMAEATGQGAASEVTPVEVPAPKPAPTKLQAIIFSPKRPSVMINGKTLFIGDKLNGYRVSAIGRESVTLVEGGQTNVLTLPE